MLSDKADAYIDDVLSYVNYTFDRKKIRLELESHLSEKITFYLQSGNPEEVAEELAIRDMGDAAETGKALNKLHKPFLGRIVKNIKTLAAIVALIILGVALFNAGAHYARGQEIKRNTSEYISNMYWEIYSTTSMLSNVENWGDAVLSTDHTVNPFSQLLFRLNTMKNYSQTAVSYIGYTEGLNSLGNMAESFDILYQGIGGGITYNGQLLCYDFLKDDVLSEKETAFLISLREALDEIEKGLVDSETKEGNFDMPLTEFEKIIRPFINKYSISNLSGIGFSN